jgi:hypothetical protein
MNDGRYHGGKLANHTGGSVKLWNWLRFWVLASLVPTACGEVAAITQSPTLEFGEGLADAVEKYRPTHS